LSCPCPFYELTAHLLSLVIHLDLSGKPSQPWIIRCVDTLRGFVECREQHMRQSSTHPGITVTALSEHGTQIWLQNPCHPNWEQRNSPTASSLRALPRARRPWQSRPLAPEQELRHLWKHAVDRFSETSQGLAKRGVPGQRTKKTER